VHTGAGYFGEVILSTNRGPGLSGKRRPEEFGARVPVGTVTTNAIVINDNVLEDRPEHGFARLESVAVDGFDLKESLNKATSAP
jgi:hypothetical protein